MRAPQTAQPGSRETTRDACRTKGNGETAISESLGHRGTPSWTCRHTMRAVPLSSKISPLKRNTFPGAIALEFSICVLLST